MKGLRVGWRKRKERVRKKLQDGMSESGSENGREKESLGPTWTSWDRSKWLVGRVVVERHTVFEMYATEL